jgi:hypothetical protein
MTDTVDATDIKLDADKSGINPANPGKPVPVRHSRQGGDVRMIRFGLFTKMGMVNFWEVSKGLRRDGHSWPWSLWRAYRVGRDMGCI